MFTSKMWERTGTDEMSQDAYVRAIAFFTLIAGIFVAGGCFVSFSWPFSWWLLLGCFFGAVLFIILFQTVDIPLLSALGVAGMCVLMGMMCGPLVALYPTLVILEAVVVTMAVMVAMSLAALVYPGFFEGWKPFALGALCLLIIAQFAQVTFIALGYEQAVNMPILAWVGVAIFIAMVAVDWLRALDIPFTLDNAIDASGGLILDGINIMIRLLSILGGKGGGRKE